MITAWLIVNLLIGAAYFIAPAQIILLYYGATNTIRRELGWQAVAFTKHERRILWSYAVFVAACGSHHFKDAFDDPHGVMIAHVGEMVAVYCAIVTTHMKRGVLLERIRKSAHAVLTPRDLKKLEEAVTRLRTS